MRYVMGGKVASGRGQPARGRSRGPATAELGSLANVVVIFPSRILEGSKQHNSPQPFAPQFQFLFTTSGPP